MSDREKKIYLTSALRNKGLNEDLAAALELEGMLCFLPQSQPYNKIDRLSASKETRHIVFEENVRAIRFAHAVVLVASRIGTDTAWECGFAVAIGKPVFLIELSDSPIDQMYMVAGGLLSENIITINSLDDGSIQNIASVIKRRLEQVSS
jgi:nucleoside 2-deoxyribosyltransferase